MLYDDPTLMVYLVCGLTGGLLALTAGISLLTGLLNRFMRKI
jgi:hypothetical protein